MGAKEADKESDKMEREDLNP